MISRHGSHLNLLRDAAAFDISFRQPGQSGFIKELEIEVIKILCCRNRFWVRERISVHNSSNNTKAAFFAAANALNAGSVTASDLPIPDDQADGHRQIGSSRAGAAQGG
jgi:hypothetical protein